MSARTSRLLVVPDADAGAHEAAQLFRTAAEESIAARDTFNVALSGGGTPKPLHRLLAANPNAIDWPRVRIFFGDERWVEPTDSRSNEKMARETLLSHVNVAPERVHGMYRPGSPAAGASFYEQAMRRELGAEGRLDLVILGIGEDGHTASLFPGMTEREELNRGLVAVVGDSPKPPAGRITLTFPALNRARRVLILATGEGKAEAVSRALSPGTAISDCPVRGVSPEAGSLTWIVDRAAYSGS